MMGRGPRILAALVMAGWGLAQAAEEADLARRLADLQAAQASIDQRLDRLEAQLQNQGLLGMLNQINTLKTDLSRLRGGMEELDHRLGQADKRQKTLYDDLDDRLNELTAQIGNLSQPTGGKPAAPRQVDAVRLQPAQSLATQAPSTPSAPSTVAPAALPDQATEEGTRTYEAALGQFKNGDYKAASSSFLAFLAAHPKDPMVPNAFYWMGLAYGAQGEFARAAAAYEKLIADYPGSSKAPDAMVSLARAYLQMGNPGEARKYLDAVVAKYPTSKSAEAARKLLATMNNP